ncbi:MAG: hypothetical protein H7837_02815 [Magnetococcus sp. MYC-9]
MKNVKIALLAGAALLVASAPFQSEAASPGQWSAGGFTQTHSSDGRTPLGVIGTQCFFCKPDAPAASVSAPAAPAASSYTAPPARQPVAMEKAKAPAQKKVAKKKAAKKKAVKKQAVKKQAVKKQSAQQNGAPKGTATRN